MDFFPKLLTYFNLGALILRSVVGIIFIYHAAPKLISPKMVAAGLKWPVFVVSILGMVELVAGAALIIGRYEQQAALALSCVMLGAIGYKVFKWKVPFSVPGKSGWEFDLILLAACLEILLSGGGRLGL